MYTADSAGRGAGLALFEYPRQRSDVAERIGTGQRLARTVADAVALALSNLWLRETLRHQSIRDPLTGLFNRRYLGETFERERSGPTPQLAW